MGWLKDRRLRAARNRRRLRTSDDLDIANEQLKLGQRRAYGGVLLGLLIAQLVAADALMYIYAASG